MPPTTPAGGRPWSPPARPERWARLAGERPRVLVVGGGITGAGIALDLALRGISVALVERGDWAAGTSSASSRLVHGGLRYLEQGEIGLVRESCLERALLLRNAAGLVWPERFLFPLTRGGVPRWKLACGLALYTLVSLPRPLGVPSLVGADVVRGAVPGIQATGLRGAGAYLDGATDDARLTLAITMSAIQAGANAISRVEAIGIERGQAGARATLRDAVSGEQHDLDVDAVVLAGGPGVDDLRRRAGLQGPRWVAPTRGSHVIVPRTSLPTDGAVILSSPVDGRVMFLIPWPEYTVIGTTDLDATEEELAPGGDLRVRATRAEVRYLLDSANGLVPDAKLGEEDVVGTWAGLRPLLASDGDPSARSREERIEVEGRVLSIAGGKLTGYRAMAEKAVGRLLTMLGERGPRRSPTREHRLHGALQAPVARPVWSSAIGAASEEHDPLATAWAKRYGSLAPAVRAVCADEASAQPLDAETLAGEVDWAVAHEDALLPSDVLLRRTDLGIGPAADTAAAQVVSRMAARLGWSAEERAEAAREAEAALALRRAWREDG